MGGGKIICIKNNFATVRRNIVESSLPNTSVHITRYYDEIDVKSALPNAWDRLTKENFILIPGEYHKEYVDITLNDLQLKEQSNAILYNSEDVISKYTNGILSIYYGYLISNSGSGWSIKRYSLYAILNKIKWE